MNTLLNKIRNIRKFEEDKWINKKIIKLNEYMKKNNLSGCVISVSGGIDSAVTYKLCKLASKQKNSPIKKVIGIAQPINSTESIWKRALLLDDNIISIDQSNVYENLSSLVTTQVGINKNRFANGQLKSYMRTPVNYYVAQLLTSEGINSIVMGTGNYDEDGYLYYFCKAGDGVVDVQLLADLHKSEVFRVAKKINVPKEIIDAKPSADLWEGQNDEDELGISYDFIELYTELLKMDIKNKKELLGGLTDKEMNKYLTMEKRANEIHNKNKHKVNFPVNL